LRLTEEFGSGFSERNLRSFRSFYRTYQERSPQIWQKPSAKLALEQKSHANLGSENYFDSAEKPYECFDEAQHERKISNDFDRSSVRPGSRRMNGGFSAESISF